MSTGVPRNDSIEFHCPEHFMKCILDFPSTMTSKRDKVQTDRVKLTSSPIRRFKDAIDRREYVNASTVRDQDVRAF